MQNLLDNPVYHALLTGDSVRSNRAGNALYFDKEVSPFAGFDLQNKNGFDELHEVLPEGRNILYATRDEIEIPTGWNLVLYIGGLQFLFTASEVVLTDDVELVPLGIQHVDEMVQLAKLTKPGPFDKRTIEFGHYYGIFEKGRLAAMTGQRLHPFPYSEISAVCTHPDFLGKGYARALLNHQVQLIKEQGSIPFLHVRADNERAVALYDKNGFSRNGPMHFYFLKKNEKTAFPNDPS